VASLGPDQVARAFLAEPGESLAPRLGRCGPPLQRDGATRQLGVEFVLQVARLIDVRAEAAAPLGRTAPRADPSLER
jgi:hypothetical protein